MVPLQVPDSQERSILMPELPDITVYVEALERRIVGERLEECESTIPSWFEPSSLLWTLPMVRRFVNCGGWVSALPSAWMMTFGWSCIS